MSTIRESIEIFNMFTARPNFPCVPSPGRTSAKVPAGYLLCRCKALPLKWPRLCQVGR